MLIKHLANVVAATLSVLMIVALPARAVNHFVSVQGNLFSPATLTINTGDTVFWTNDDILLHTVTSGNPCSSNGQFNSLAMNPSDQFSFTFNSVGSFNYFCAFHCLIGMTGSVTVQQAPTPVPTPAPIAILGQNFPNPFNPSTTIEYSLSARARAVMSIYNSEGALVVRLDQGVREAGPYRVEWNGRDAAGKPVGSGVYFYRLEGELRTAPRKMVLLK